MKIFGREPALTLGVIQAVIMVLIAGGVVDWTNDQSTLLIAAITAGFALLTAWATVEKRMSLLVGLGTAVVACAAGFGADLSTELQASLVALVSVGAAWFTRTQTAPATTVLSDA